VIKKESTTRRSARLKSVALVDWTATRVGNLDRMLAEASRDDAALYAYSTRLLDALAQLLSGVGDEAGSLYASSLARRLEQKHCAAQRAKRKSR